MFLFLFWGTLKTHSFKLNAYLGTHTRTHTWNATKAYTLVIRSLVDGCCIERCKPIFFVARLFVCFFVCYKYGTKLKMEYLKCVNEVFQFPCDIYLYYKISSFFAYVCVNVWSCSSESAICVDCFWRHIAKIIFV